MKESPARQYPLNLFKVVLLLLALATLAWSLSALLATKSGDMRSSPSVVIAVKDLARLETVEYSIERVIDLRDRQSLLFGLVKTQDAILFVAVGQVSAGYSS